MSLHMADVEVTAALELRVPRGEAGSLDQGARTVLAKIDCVREVDVERIDGMRPDAFDLYVDVVAQLRLDAEPEANHADLVALLRDGFGVTDVERLDVR
ncbi:hypothetical protein [Halorarius litoreus]|uniref:hypothetical protein n=1 Tax=Halorarius litoreus TaxID=2962676 RepID=UPI0020CEAC3F|nr:hypothetical protein [Halorarius litoreus]